MPKRADIEKVLLIGSGPIVIGQAAEFDFSGSQACTSLREEGVKVALVNSNPATIMTDPNMADAVYIEPLKPDIVAAIVKKSSLTGSSQVLEAKRASILRPSWQRWAF